MSKYTKDDIKRIAKGMRRQKKDKPDHPFALITGAGCSKSAEIPLAGELTKLINNKFPEECEILDKEDRKKYGACMAILSANECRDLFKPFLKRAKVNWGHIAIASMMDAGFIGRVLTFNFDSILAQACGLLGLYPATYDFVTGVSDRTDFISNPAILHLHGQGHGIAMLNSDEETEDHAKKLRPLLTSTFSQHPTLIIGYSGSSDAVFDHMCDIYTGAERLTWVGYNEDCPPHVQKLLNKRPGTSKFTGGADSDEFLMELALELGCFPPTLFKDPYAHLLDGLKIIANYPLVTDENKKDTKIDILTELKQRLTTAQKESAKTPDRIMELFLENKWEAVISEIGDNPKTDHEKSVWASAKFRLALNLQRKLSPTIEDLEKASDLYKEISQVETDNYDAFNNWGNAISELAKTKQDEKLFEESIEKYQKAIEIKDDFHGVFNNWGNAILGLAKIRRDEKLFEESFGKYQKAIEIKDDFHQGFNNWGTAISDLAQLRQDEKLFEESIEKYQKAIEIKDDYHNAFNNWGNAILNLAKIRRDEKLFAESIEKYQKAIEIKDDSHEAFNNWGNAILNLAKIRPDEKLFAESFEKYQKAIEIKGDYHGAYDNWTSSLIHTFHLTQNPKFLEDAEKTAIKAKNLNSDALYNLACVKALQGETNAAKDTLLHCEEKSTLPARDHLESDTDLDPLRGLNWFKELLTRLE